MIRGTMLIGCALVLSCANVECSLNSDCGDRARCELNRCVRDCVQDRDCAKGEVCSVNGACVARSPTDDRPAPDDVERDVGVDVAADLIVVSDAGPPLDQAVTDAVALDAPPFDAPPFDAPPFDAPPFDAPPFDVAPLDTPVADVSIDRPAVDVAPLDVARDVPAADAAVGPVGVGVYEYIGVRPSTLVAPVAAAWHPSGSYALVLSATNTVFRFDPAAMTVTQVAMTASDVAWRAVSFVPDGSRALLVANTTTTSGGTTSRRGRVFVWDHAASTLSERAADQWTMGTYQALRWNREGTRAALLGNATSYLSIWFYGADGARAGSPIAFGRVMNTGCNDLGWITDGFGDPALAIGCGINTAEILTATDLTGTARFTTAVAAGAVGNVYGMSVRPQGDVALCVSGSSRLGRYRDGRWDTSFGTPSVNGASSVTFSTDGARALAYGGFGRVHEYRYDLFAAGDVVDVSISNLAATPFTQPSGATLNAMAWRPGCDEGMAVGGANTFSGTSAFVAVFRVTNGRRCP